MSLQKNSEIKETPLMKQYNSIKAKYPDTILLFRVGDFYETFGNDAIAASKVLGIVLTKRANGAASHVELAGFPHHSLDSYLPKLVRAGYRVAICDQLEDPKMVKGIVKRGITELVTPGVSFNDKILNHTQNNFLASVYFGIQQWGLALCDVSTGEFIVAQGKPDYIEKLIQNFKPNELLYQKNKRQQTEQINSDKTYLFALDDWAFGLDFGLEKLTAHFETNSLKGFGIEAMNDAISASGAIMHYLSETKHDKLKHIIKISRLNESDYVWLDKFTIKNLELFASNNEHGKSLVDIVDKTVSPMGARLLKRWIALPLKELTQINNRLEAVDFFISNTLPHETCISLLTEVGDLERLISKVAAQRVNPRELVQLQKSLILVEQLKLKLQNTSNSSINALIEQLNPCSSLIELLQHQLNNEAPVNVLKGNVINVGVNEDLDELRNIAYNGKDYLLKIQQSEIEKTGISTLKIAFNNVFGYYLEVTNTHKDKVPSDWIRKQTLTSAERYITPELKIYEEKILGAEEKILAIEQQLYIELLSKTSEYISTIQNNAHCLSKLDVLSSFATLAKLNKYEKPLLSESFVINIIEGRHPVIEKQLPIGTDYVSNSIFLDNEAQQIIMVTGPNMSGKSALLRQTALIVLMAQIGCYVPAQVAEIGLIDKIFTRVGATDNISSGESTFMVEMNETASILNNLSNRSLVLLDEIGRGTSTYDGISIAWSIAEYIHEHPSCKAKTLFATHYHELNEMTNLFNRIKNYNVSVKETDNKIVFLRKLIPGGSEHSFGIHVARMAGMPKSLIENAKKILKKLEHEHEADLLNKNNNSLKPSTQNASDEMQLSFFQLNDPVLERIREEIYTLDINTLTPVEALFKLNEIKRLLGAD